MKLWQELTRSDVQSVPRKCKLLSDVSNDFKTYHFAIVDQLQDDEGAETQHEVLLDDPELKVMELIDCIG